MSKIIDGIAKDLKAIPETLKAKTAGVVRLQAWIKRSSFL